MAFINQLLGKSRVSEFLDDFWCDELFVLNGEIKRLEALRAIPELFDLGKLRETFKDDVVTWYPPTKDKELSARIHEKKFKFEEAMKYYDAGATLYLVAVENHIPELRAVCRDFEKDLGIPAGTIRVEMFASAQGSGTPPHFDHELNFNIQLVGTKKWKVSKNTQAPYPVVHYKPVNGPPKGEESKLYIPGDLPNEVPEPSKSFETGPGSLVFLPQGYWHSTVTAGESLAMSFVVCPVFWLDAFLRAVSRKVLKIPGMRRRAIFSHGAKSFLKELPAVLDTAREEINKLTSEDLLSALEPSNITRYKVIAPNSKFSPSENQKSKLTVEPSDGKVISIPDALVDLVKWILSQKEFDGSVAFANAGKLSANELAVVLKLLKSAGVIREII